MEYELVNAGVPVTARFADADVEGIFLPLLRRMTAMQAAKGGRLLALLAAPPAAGKSTLAALLERLSRETPGLTPLCAIGMDGFHRRQSWLLGHTVRRDGETIPMARIKGAPETFDLPLLLERLRRVAAGEDCPWPRYDRTLHDPVEDGGRVSGEIVLLEGNYLLLDAEGWRALRDLADMTIFVSADPAFLRGRLLARHLAGGKSTEDAARIVERSDMANIRLCLERSLPADVTLALGEDGRYKKADS